MESEAVKKLFDSNKDKPKLVATSQTLVKLIQNAIQKDEEKFRRIRLSNPKIQRAVLSQLGALDVLVRAGFYKSKDEDNGEAILLYKKCRENKKVSTDIIRQLEAKVERLAASTSNSTFLSEEQRKKRQESAREKRKAQKAAKDEAKRRWQEDKEARAEIEARNTAAKQATAQTGAGCFAPGPSINIRRIATPVSNPPNTSNSMALPDELQKQSKRTKELMDPNPELDEMSFFSGDELPGDSDVNPSSFSAPEPTTGQGLPQPTIGQLPPPPTIGQAFGKLFGGGNEHKKYPKNWFPPANSHNQVANADHVWGGGYRLADNTNVGVASMEPKNTDD